MNMIPLVRATEQGRAHFVNRKLAFELWSGDLLPL
jgi:hypothetical protein